MDFPDAKPAVFVLIVNEEKQILLGRRKVGPQEARWQTPESSAYESWKWVSKDELERLYEEYKAAEEDGKIDDFKGEILCLTLRVLLKNQGRGTHSINHLFDIPYAYPSLDSSGLY
ncbi:hypothetical protein APSETT444_004737 [Aspergillus pseudonomiae]